MPIDPDELVDVRIEDSVFCEKCGYNLRTLRISGRCPECGSWYCGRWPRRQGVIQPEEIVFPTGDVCTALGLCGFTAALILALVSGGKWSVPGVAFLALCVVSSALAVWHAWSGIARYFLLLRRIMDR